MDNLNFIETYTVEQFKDESKVSRVDVLRNDATNKLFFSYGKKTGAVASKGIPEHPMFSLVHPSLTREPNEEEMKHIGCSVLLGDKRVPDPRANGYFFLLHEEGQGGAAVVATF